MWSTPIGGMNSPCTSTQLHRAPETWLLDGPLCKMQIAAGGSNSANPGCCNQKVKVQRSVTK